jgi:hypothetical protein
VALADTLSALRALILDDIEGLLATPDRASFIRERFPSLTADEVADLARIPPQQLETYTRNIFSGISSTIENHFPVTFDVLEKLWRMQTGDRLSSVALIRMLHRASPWKGNTTAALAANFVSFLSGARSPLPEYQELLGECARLELLILKVARSTAPKPPISEFSSPEKFKQLTVEQLLGLSFKVAEGAEALPLSYDVVGYRDKLRGETLEDEDLPIETPSGALVSRTRDNIVRVVSIPEIIAEELIGSSDTPRTIGELADAFLTAADDSLPEAKLFEQFLKMIVAAVQAEAFLIYAADKVSDE